MNWVNWPINLISVVLLTTVTGSFALLVWRIVGWLLVSLGYARWYYYGLRVVIILFLLPIAYIGLVWVNSQYSRWGGTLFLLTPAIGNTCIVLSLLWLSGAGIICGRFVYEAICLYRKNKSCFSCDDSQKRILERICAEMKIPAGRIRLCQNYKTRNPEFTGTLQPKVILPVREWEESELHTVFIHELTHYKQRDIYWKRLVMLATLIHYFNPLVWMLSKWLHQWSEYSCDESACSRMGDMRAYFENIVNIVENFRREKRYFAMHLAEDKNELLERIEHMRKLRSTKRKPVGIAVVSSLLMTMSCSATVLAAADGAAKQYQNWFEATEVAVGPEKNQMQEYVEYTEYGPSIDITVEREEGTADARAINNFSWEVPGSYRKESGNLYAKEGQVISVNVYANNHTDKSLNVGIVEPDGTRRFVTGKGSIYHNFEVFKSGTYRVYVQNSNSVTISVEGTFRVG